MWQQTTKSSQYRTSTGLPWAVRMPSGPYRTPAASSSPCNATFRSNGLITPPCGLPSSVGANPLPGSNTPAVSQPRISSRPGKDPIADIR